MKKLSEIISEVPKTLTGKKEVIIVGEEHPNLEHKYREMEILERYKPAYLLWEGYKEGKIDEKGMLLYNKARENGTEIINHDIDFKGRLPFTKELNELDRNHYTDFKKEEERIEKSKYYLEKYDSWIDAINPKREQYMFDNIKKYVEKNNYNEKPIVVVTGRNHLKGISEKLDNEGISYKKIDLSPYKKRY